MKLYYKPKYVECIDPLRNGFWYTNAKTKTEEIYIYRIINNIIFKQTLLKKDIQKLLLK